jgi:hypothetical protein
MLIRNQRGIKRDMIADQAAENPKLCPSCLGGIPMDIAHYFHKDNYLCRSEKTCIVLDINDRPDDG